MTFRETVAYVKAKRIRAAIARLYKKHPARAVAHVNERLDAASRGEVLREQLQYQEALAGG